MIRICILDDHELFRFGIVQIISEQEGFEVVCEAASGEELLANLPGSDWHILVADMSLPDMSGIEVIKAVKRKKPELPILVLSMHNEEQYGSFEVKNDTDFRNPGGKDCQAA